MSRLRWVPIGLLAGSLTACGAPPVHEGPVVLITIDALRADALGALGGNPRLTPELDRFARRADWAGPAVAPSSWTVPSMASLMTGLRPWSTGSFAADYAGLAPSVTTLAEALHESGYRTTGFYTNTWLRPRFGYDQGFDRYERLKDRPRPTESFLETLGPEREFVWIHILPPHAPYVRHQRFLDRIDVPAEEIPEKVRPLDLEPYFDPAIELPPNVARQFRAAYDLHAAHADALAGRFLDALERSGQWDRSLVIVTADHGEEFGENGQIGHGGNLGRALIEVPLLIKLPARWPRPLALEPGQRPGTVRVAATLIEAVGGVRPGGMARSLFEAPGRGVLSELYLGNGVNQFSLIEGDLQALWQSRFAPALPGYFEARKVGLGLSAELAGVSPEAVFAHLRSEFALTRPLTGAAGTLPSLELRRWSAKDSETIDDEVTLRAMSRRLRERWLEHHGPERLPGQPNEELPLEPEALEELRSLGYVGGG